MDYFKRLTFLLLMVNPIYGYTAYGYKFQQTLGNIGVSTTIKNVVSKSSLTASTTAYKTYPAAANGTQIGTTTVGAVNSSVYSGSAAASTKISVPLKSGTSIAFDAVSNISKTNMANAAMTLIKSPTFALAVIIGTSLYDWYTSSQVNKDANGNITVPGYNFNYFSPFYVDGSPPETECNRANPSKPINTITWTFFNATNIDCLSNGVSFGQINFISYTTSPQSNPTDTQIVEAMKRTAISNPATTLADFIKNNVEPTPDNPIVTGPASVSGQPISNVEPDGTIVKVTPTYNLGYSGDTVTATETDAVEITSPSGAVTNKTATNPLPIDNTVPGTQPTSTTDQTPTQTDCEKYPNDIGCSEYGTPADPEVIATVEQPVTMTYNTVTSTCPAPLSLNTHRGNFTMSLQPTCDALTIFNPIVILISLISAAYLVMGGIRE